MDEFNSIINSNPIVLIDFFATWCGPCKAMHPVLEQLKVEMGDEIRILKIDVDKNESLAARFHIQSVPTLIMFLNGTQTWRHSGAMPLVALTQAIEQH